MDTTLLTRQDVSNMLHIPLCAVDLIVKNKQIRYIPIGKRKYFTEEFIEEFINKSKKKDIVEIPEKRIN